MQSLDEYRTSNARGKVIHPLDILTLVEIDGDGVQFRLTLDYIALWGDAGILRTRRFEPVSIRYSRSSRRSRPSLRLAPSVEAFRGLANHNDRCLLLTSK